MRATLLIIDLIITLGSLGDATHAATLAEAHFDAQVCMLGLAGLGLFWITERR